MSVCFDLLLEARPTVDDIKIIFITRLDGQDRNGQGRQRRIMAMLGDTLFPILLFTNGFHRIATFYSCSM